MKILLTIVCLLGLGFIFSGCDQQLNPNLITKKYIIHMPPGKFFYCPLVSLPNTFTLDRDVAKLLVNAYENNTICHNNMLALKADLESQLKIYGK